MSQIKPRHFRVQPGDPVDLSAWPTRIDSPCDSKADAAAMIARDAPADDKETARLIVSQIILEAVECLDLAFPKPSETDRRELLADREELAH